MEGPLEMSPKVMLYTQIHTRVYTKQCKSVVSPVNDMDAL